MRDVAVIQGDDLESHAEFPRESTIGYLRPAMSSGNGKKFRLAATLDRQTLRRLAGSSSFSRGERYFGDGHVRSLDEHRGTIVAKVEGTTAYGSFANTASQSVSRRSQARQGQLRRVSPNQRSRSTTYTPPLFRTSLRITRYFGKFHTLATTQVR